LRKKLGDTRLAAKAAAGWRILQRTAQNIAQFDLRKPPQSVMWIDAFFAAHIF